MRRIFLSLLLLCAASCVRRTGEVAPVGGIDARGAADAGSPGVDVDHTGGGPRGEPARADAASPGPGIDSTKGEAGRAAPPGIATREARAAEVQGGPPDRKDLPDSSGTPVPAAPAARPVPASGGTVPDVAYADLSAPEFASALPPAKQPARGAGTRARLVGSARRFVGRRFRGDCTGFVRRVLGEAHVSLPSLHPARTMTESLYTSLPHVGRPRPGDLAFFHATRSHDRPGSPRSHLTHVAMVEKVDGARVTLIHRGSSGIRRFVMNLERPHDRHENDAVRRHRRSDAPGTRYLAAELFTGYATPLASRAPVGGRPKHAGELVSGARTGRRSRR